MKANNSETLQRMIAGGSAGMIAKSFVAPFERVKIVCQTGESIGLIATASKIWRMEGTLGFWRGNAAACLRIVPHKAALFGCSDMYKDLLSKYFSDEVSTYSPFIAGSLSGVTASMLTYPLDLVRTRLAGTIQRVHQSILSVFHSTIQKEGFFAIFRGIGPTVTGSIPYEGIKFGSYDILKEMLPTGVDPSVDIMGKLVCGGGAGVLATIVMYPNDTVRRRLQMQGSGKESVQYRNAIHCYCKILRMEGVSAFYRGLTPTLIRAVPNMGIQFASYEFLKGRLR